MVITNGTTLINEHGNERKVINYRITNLATFNQYRIEFEIETGIFGQTRYFEFQSSAETMNTDKLKYYGFSPKTVKSETLLICLNDRQTEFKQALKRGENNRLEVYDDFEPDTFVVVNLDNKSEYRVMLKTIDGKVYANCECGDFKNRSRICKHQSEVLVSRFFGLSVSKANKTYAEVV